MKLVIGSPYARKLCRVTVVPPLCSSSDPQSTQQGLQLHKNKKSQLLLTVSQNFYQSQDSLSASLRDQDIYNLKASTLNTVLQLFALGPEFL